MAVSAALTSPAARRSALLALLIAALAVAVGIAIFRPGMAPDRIGAFGDRVASQAGNTAANLKALGNTVSQIFESRSPGERLGGALASLKHARRPAIHERALPKIRGPVSPLAAIVGAPAIPPVAAPPVETPLYNAVQGTPVPIAAPPPGGGPPAVFPGAPPLPGGGGGGVIFPPVVTQPPVTPPVTPPETPPTTPSVPEPSSWAMMLLGFALIGGTLRWTGKRRLKAI